MHGDTARIALSVGCTTGLRLPTPLRRPRPAASNRPASPWRQAPQQRRGRWPRCRTSLPAPSGRRLRGRRPPRLGCEHVTVNTASCSVFRASKKDCRGHEGQGRLKVPSRAPVGMLAPGPASTGPPHLRRAAESRRGRSRAAMARHRGAGARSPTPCRSAAAAPARRLAPPPRPPRRRRRSLAGAPARRKCLGSV